MRSGLRRYGLRKFWYSVYHCWQGSQGTLRPVSWQICLPEQLYRCLPRWNHSEGLQRWRSCLLGKGHWTRLLYLNHHLNQNFLNPYLLKPDLINPYLLKPDLIKPDFLNSHFKPIFKCWPNQRSFNPKFSFRPIFFRFKPNDSRKRYVWRIRSCNPQCSSGFSGMP